MQGGLGLISDQGTKIPHATQCVAGGGGGKLPIYKCLGDTLTMSVSLVKNEVPKGRNCVSLGSASCPQKLQ